MCVIGLVKFRPLGVRIIGRILHKIVGTCWNFGSKDHRMVWVLEFENNNLNLAVGGL